MRGWRCGCKGCGGGVTIHQTPWHCCALLLQPLLRRVRLQVFKGGDRQVLAAARVPHPSNAAHQRAAESTHAFSHTFSHNNPPSTARGPLTAHHGSHCVTRGRLDFTHGSAQTAAIVSACPFPPAALVGERSSQPHCTHAAPRASAALLSLGPRPPPHCGCHCVLHAPASPYPLCHACRWDRSRVSSMAPTGAGHGSTRLRPACLRCSRAAGAWEWPSQQCAVKKPLCTACGAGADSLGPGGDVTTLDVCPRTHARAQRACRCGMLVPGGACPRVCTLKKRNPVVSPTTWALDRLAPSPPLAGVFASGYRTTRWGAPARVCATRPLGKLCTSHDLRTSRLAT
jgi:hypothetical protein